MGKKQLQTKGLPRETFDSTWYRELSADMKGIWVKLWSNASGVGEALVDAGYLSFHVSNGERRLSKEDIRQALGSSVVWTGPERIWFPDCFPVCWQNRSVKHKSVRSMMQQYVDLADRFSAFLATEFLDLAADLRSKLEAFELSSNKTGEEGQDLTKPCQGLEIIDNRSKIKEEEEEAVFQKSPFETRALAKIKNKLAQGFNIDFDKVVNSYPKPSDFNEAMRRLYGQMKTVQDGESFSTALSNYLIDIETGVVPAKYVCKLENFIGLPGNTKWHQWIGGRQARSESEIDEALKGVAMAVRKHGRDHSREARAMLGEDVWAVIGQREGFFKLCDSEWELSSGRLRKVLKNFEPAF